MAISGGVLAAILVACGSAEDGSQATPAATPALPGLTIPAEPETPRASPKTSPKLPEGEPPELAGLKGWINSEPFTIAERTSEGGVVLIDFWTYTCVNCIRTFPFLRDWQDKYADAGLTILGVHTPEFDFEKDRSNVLRAM